ncbi:hypothetical protein [Streptomyces sp. NPDC005262]|uniref:hypothetical protein n=1 Tax=Streptomyces sp. NPDC005262 TaxID=3364710 RepID=UPI003694C06B
MSNLGRYQDITAAAKAAGGVDKLVKAIEKVGFVKGAWVGAAGGLAVGGAVAAAGHFRGVKKAAEEAKEQLKAEVQESTDLNDK